MEQVIEINLLIYIMFLPEKVGVGSVDVMVPVGESIRIVVVEYMGMFRTLIELGSTVEYIGKVVATRIVVIPGAVALEKMDVVVIPGMALDVVVRISEIDINVATYVVESGSVGVPKYVGVAGVDRNVATYVVESGSVGVLKCVGVALLLDPVVETPLVALKYVTSEVV